LLACLYDLLSSPGKTGREEAALFQFDAWEQQSERLSSVFRSEFDPNRFRDPELTGKFKDFAIRCKRRKSLTAITALR